MQSFDLLCAIGYSLVYALLFLPVALPLRGFLDEARVGYLRGWYTKWAGMALSISRVAGVCVQGFGLLQWRYYCLVCVDAGVLLWLPQFVLALPANIELLPSALYTPEYCGTRISWHSETLNFAILYVSSKNVGLVWGTCVLVWLPGIVV